MNTNFILNIKKNSLFKKLRTKKSFDYLICEASTRLPFAPTEELKQYFDYVFEKNKLPSRFVVKNMNFSLLTPFTNKKANTRNNNYICEVKIN